MPQEKISLIVLLKDGVSKSARGMSRAVQTLRNNWIKITAAVAGVTAVAVDSIRKFQAQEDAVEKLNQALKNQGAFTEQTSRDIQEYAASLQKVTTVGDETILNQQALLVTFGLQGKELQRATEASLDLSAGLGIDLKAAALLVGKAFAGDISTLSRYGIKIQEGLEESEKFEAVLQKLNQQFGGQARARLNTFSGQVENLKNRVGDLQERLGKELLPVLKAWARWGDKIVTQLERMTGATGNELTVNEIAIKQTEKRIEQLKERTILNRILGQSKRELNEDERNELMILTDRLNKLREMAAEERAIEEQKRLAKEEDAIANEIMENRIQSKQLETVGVQIKNWQKLRANSVITAKDIEGAFVKTFDKMTTHMGQAFADMITEGKSFSDSFKGIWKSLANFVIAEITRMIAKMLVFRTIATAIGGPFGGFLPFAQGGAVNLQSGGLVRPRPGGVPALIGEGGSPEAVIPLNDQRTISELKDALGTSESEKVNVTFGDINVSVDRISTDDEDETIDQIIESVRRETVKGLRLALELKNRADQNDNLAV